MSFSRSLSFSVLQAFLLSLIHIFMVLQILVHIQHRELLAVKAGQKHIHDDENVQRLCLDVYKRQAMTDAEFEELYIMPDGMVDD